MFAASKLVLELLVMVKQWGLVGQGQLFQSSDAIKSNSTRKEVRGQNGFSVHKYNARGSPV